MAMVSYKTKNYLNPELEALRSEGLRKSASDSNEWIFRLMNKTSRIHAGFLFEDRKTLQNLCLFISETQNKITDAGWEAFGYNLGLNPSVLKVINNNNFNREDPCYNVMLAYVQYENASIGKIIRALNAMGRIDVLSRIHHSVNDLADAIFQCSDYNDNSITSEETSDYESLTSCEGNNQNNSINIWFSSDVLIKPKVIPPAPFIFQNLQATPEFTAHQLNQALKNIVINSDQEECQNQENLSEKIKCFDSFFNNHNVKLIAENLQTSSITNGSRRNVKSEGEQKYGIKILLTFAEDGEKYAVEVCKVLRKKRNNCSKIGVLVLSEHAGIVNKDPQQFISGAVSQVDYVCPILTSGYFDLISRKQKVSSSSNIHMDALYVPYIFRLMNSYFISNDCLNDKVRSIIPEDEFCSIPIKTLWTNPIFGAWVKLSEIDDLAVRLLKKEKKFL